VSSQGAKASQAKKILALEEAIPQAFSVEKKINSSKFYNY
jgi:hypothetical protein